MVAPRDIPRDELDLPPRFWAKVELAPGCWNWTASLTRAGYGRFRLASGRHVLAHRFLFIAMMGPIGERLVCHRCDNPRCVNPLHLFIGTHRDNARDRDAKGRGANGTEGMTACRRGHPRTPENIYLWRTSIHCLKCREVMRRSS